jgi:hypothetical protein
VALSPLLFNFASNYSIFKVQENQVGLKLSKTHHLLVCANDLHLFGNNIKKSTETLFDASKEAGLEVNTQKTTYMLLSRHQNAGKSLEIKLANIHFEDVAQIRYLVMRVTN